MDITTIEIVQTLIWSFSALVKAFSAVALVKVTFCSYYEDPIDNLILSRVVLILFLAYFCLCNGVFILACPHHYDWYWPQYLYLFLYLFHEDWPCRVEINTIMLNRNTFSGILYFIKSRNSCPKSCMFNPLWSFWKHC